MVLDVGRLFGWTGGLRVARGAPRGFLAVKGSVGGSIGVGPR